MKKIAINLAPLEEKIDQMTPPQKVAMVILTVVAIGALFFFFRYKPQAQTIRSLRSSIGRQQRRLATLKHAAVSVDKLKKEYAKSLDTFHDLLALLPNRKEIPDLLENISRVGAQEGLENLLFQPKKEQKHDFYATIPIRLDLVGTYHRLGIFLDKVSRLPRIIKVENLGMKRRKDSTLQVSCFLKTYRFLEEGERPKQSKKK